jgi:hypothetical protein
VAVAKVATLSNHPITHSTQFGEYHLHLEAAALIWDLTTSSLLHHGHNRHPEVEETIAPHNELRCASMAAEGEALLVE